MFDSPLPIYNRHKIKLGKYTVSFGWNAPRGKIILLLLIVAGLLCTFWLPITTLGSLSAVEKQIQQQTYSCGHHYVNIKTGVNIEHSKFCSVCGAAVSPPSMQVEGISLTERSLRGLPVSYIHAALEGGLVAGTAQCKNKEISSNWEDRLTHCPICGMPVELRNPVAELMPMMNIVRICNIALLLLWVVLIWTFTVRLWYNMGFLQIRVGSSIRSIKKSGWTQDSIELNQTPDEGTRYEED